MVGRGLPTPAPTTGHTPQTTPLHEPASQFVTITHPYHPLRGQQVKVIRICRGSDPDLVIQCPDGSHIVVAMSCTDYATPQDFDSPLDSPHLLDLEGLRQAVRLIARIRQEERDPVVDDIIRRFLQHVLPKGFVKVRHYGFLASGCRPQLAALRQRLGSLAADQPSDSDVDSGDEPSAEQNSSNGAAVLCPSCGRPPRVPPRVLHCEYSWQAWRGSWRAYAAAVN